MLDVQPLLEGQGSRSFHGPDERVLRRAAFQSLGIGLQGLLDARVIPSRGVDREDGCRARPRACREQFSRIDQAGRDRIAVDPLVSQPDTLGIDKSEERSVGEEWVSTWKIWGSP